MTVKIIFSEEEKSILKNTLNLIMQYRKHDISSGPEYMETLQLVNGLSMFIDKTCLDN